MSMATYDDLVTRVKSWLNRENFPALDIEVEDLMAMAQRRIFRECDFKAFEEKVDFTVSVPTVPADYERTKVMRYYLGNRFHSITGAPLHQVLTAGNGNPSIYAIEAGDFVFGPSPEQDYTITLTYYKSLPLLSTSNQSNWLSTDAPELVLFGTLLEAALWLKDDQRAQVWEGRFNQTKMDIELSEEKADKEGGSLQVRGRGAIGGFESVLNNS